MGYHPRIGSPDYASFNTIRCKNSRLWFANNPKLEKKILSYVAKYNEKYKVTLYAIAIEGSHTQDLADFPYQNRSDYMRDRNSVTAKLVQNYNPTHEGGGVFSRRYSAELVPQHQEDIEDRFFYTVLQPVQDGLAIKISDYPFYNCFHDAAWGIRREFKVVDWTKYNKAKRSNPKAKIKQFETKYYLKFARIPGYDHLTQRQYALMLTKKLEERRQVIVAERLAKGLGFLGPELLKQVIPGSKPKNTKTSDRYSFRPRVLSVCKYRRAEAKEFYFDCYYKFQIASDRYRKGFLDTEFPEGMYKPSCRPPPHLAAA